MTTKKSSTKSKKPTKVEPKGTLIEVFRKGETTPADAQKLALVQKDVSDRMLQQAKSTAITDAKGLQGANEALLAISRAKAQVEERRTALVKPLRDHIKFIDGLFSPVKEALESADALLRDKVLTYRREEEAALAEQRRKVEEAAAEAKRKAEEAAAKAEKAKGKKAEALTAEATSAATAANDAALAVMTAPVQSRVMGTESGQVAARKRWAFKVTDDAIVPRQYLCVDEGAIRAAVKSGLREIPGVSIFEEETLAVGGL